MATPVKTKAHPDLPNPPIRRWLSPIQRFLHIESSSGLVLLACTAVALVLANSAYAEWYNSLWKTPVGVTWGNFTLAGDIGHLVINDGLMAIFFFVIGLEVKREIVDGELSEFRKALLPVMAAIGGMVVPAGVFLASQAGQPGARGWAIPMATDIAFVVGFLALFGKRVPFSLKIFLLSLAIVDDLGAVTVIALVLTDTIAYDWLAVAGGVLGFIYAMNLSGVRTVMVYVLAGSVVWLAVYKSGVHATVAGVLLGLLTPASAWIGDKTFATVVGDLVKRLRGAEPDTGTRQGDLAELRFVAREAVSPLHRLEADLHPWVAFFVMPLFALANAGVPLDPSGLRDPFALAIAAGLAIGKPLGIVGFSLMAVASGLTQLPKGVTWAHVVGGACLAGIGFTMALFINGLAFPVAEFPKLEAVGKIGILLGSLVSALLGAGILLLLVKKPEAGAGDATS